MVIREVRLQLNTEEVCHGLSCRRPRPVSAALRRRVADILERIHAQGWLQPAVTYRLHCVKSRDARGLDLGRHGRLEARGIAHRLRGASHIAVGAYTVGDVLERQVRDWMAAGNTTQAVLLDDIGTLALFQLGDRFEAMVRDSAREMGLKASGALSPGDDGFDIGHQGPSLALAGAADIGMSMSGPASLVPHKSLTAVMGVGERMRYWARGESCAACRARERCPYGTTAATGAAA